MQIAYNERFRFFFRWCEAFMHGDGHSAYKQPPAVVTMGVYLTRMC